MAFKESLQYLNMNACSIGHIHPVWNVIDPNMIELANIQAKLLVQRYPLHGMSCSGKMKSLYCPLCKEETETLAHFLLHCPRLQEIRNPFIRRLTEIVGEKKEEEVLQIILDPSILNVNSYEQRKLAMMTRKLCYVLHCERNKLLGGQSLHKFHRQNLSRSIMY